MPMFISVLLRTRGTSPVQTLIARDVADLCSSGSTNLVQPVAIPRPDQTMIYNTLQE